MRILALSLLALACGPALLAQGGRAIILGQVTDVSGAAVSGAEIKVVQKSTRVVRATRTNEAGNYEVPGLLPDTYRIEAAHPGFKTAIVDDLLVTSARRLEVNLTVQVGEVREAVTVTADKQILDTVSADVNTVVDAKKISDLPIGQGHATLLYMMVPGAASAGSMDNQPMQRAMTSRVRFNGSPDGTAEYSIDGTPNMERGNASPGGGSAFNPTTETVQEVRVQTSTFDASIGHTGGSSVDIILKSGSNDFHGTAVGYVRDPDWNANSWAGNRGGVPRPSFTYRRWGFTGGGPVRLGPLYNGTDRTFFFYGFDNWSSFSPNPPFNATVPRPAQLTGDLSDLLRLGPQYQIYDPDTARIAPNGRIQRSPFPGNIIPAARIHPASAAIAKLWPAPNNPGSAEGLWNLTYDLGPLPRKMWSSSLRLDHNLSASHKLFGRFLLSHTQIPYQSLYGRTDLTNLSFDARNWDLAASDVWTISPTFVAEFRLAFMRFPWVTTPLGVGVDYKELGLEHISKLIGTATIGLPSITVAGYRQHEQTANTAFATSAGAYETSEIRTLAGNFTKVLRNHSFKFGADVRQYVETRGAQDLLRIDFSGIYSNGPLDNSPQPPLGTGLADFLLGRFTSSQISQPSKAANLSTYQGIYFQDDWKVTSRLTVNLGIRYEREGPPTERFNRALAGFAFDADSPIAATARANYAQNPVPGLPAAQFAVRGGVLYAGTGGNPRTIYRTDKNNFAPRIGMAFQLFPDTVVRAGYGIYYVPYGQRFFANEGGVPGFDVSTLSYSTSDSGLTFNRTLSDLFPAGLDKPVGSSLGLATFMGQNLSLRPFGDNPNAYNQRWQLSVQQRIASVYKLEVRYVGNRTVKMPITRNLNALPNQYLSRSPERDQPTIDFLSGLVPNPFYGIQGVGGSIGTSRNIARSQLLRPFPQFGNITFFNHQGWTRYNGLQIEFERRFNNGLSFQTSYTFTKTLDGLTYLNEGDPQPERVLSTSDIPQVWRWLAVWELPFGKGRRFASGWTGLPAYLVGGWQIQGVAYIQNGGLIDWGNILFRGNIKDIPVADQAASRMFNVDAGFERTTARQLQNNIRTFPSRLNGVRSSTAANTDFSIIKNTTVKERFTFQFRAEAYNAWNQHYLSGANTTPTNAAFGTTTQATGPRAVQLGLRFLF